MYDIKKLETIKDILIKKRQTLAVAESVTSGYVQLAFSQATDARKYFQGGITVYNAGQKTKHLNVEPIYALASNCVSDQVATQMATNVSELFLSNIGISITGYAAPVPELDIKDVFAYYAIAENGKVLVCEKITSKGKDPQEVQLDYARQIIDATIKLLSGNK